MAVNLIQTAVERRIREALRRDATSDAAPIHVIVEGEKVTLRGVVRTSGEIRAVANAAWATSGVQGVESHLSVVENPAPV